MSKPTSDVPDILTAVSHRDYRHPGSVFVRQFPRRIEIVSPGGFPAGVTPENILYRQNARNRLIADNLARCGLVERAGQGANRMFAESVRQGSGKHYGVRVDPLNLHRLIAWVDSCGVYMSEEDLRALGDPDFPGIDRLPIRPRVATAPVIERP